MNVPVAFDAHRWAVDNFAGCDLGDQRRESRLVTLAEQVADRPSESLPKIADSWSDLKALYRLLDRVGQLEAIGAEELDAVVVEGIVRGRDHHTEIGAH